MTPQSDDRSAILLIIIETTFNYLRDLKTYLPELTFALDLEAAEGKMKQKLAGQSVTFSVAEKEFIGKVFYAGIDWVQNLVRATPQLQVLYRPGISRKITGYSLQSSQRDFIDSIVQ